MKKYFCDICEKPFTEGHKAGTPQPLTGVVGVLTDGMDICENCMMELRSRIWEPRIWDMIRKEVAGHGEK